MPNEYKESRYHDCSKHTDYDGNVYLGMRYPIKNPVNSDDIFHTVQQGDRLDTLAKKYLGKASLWWVIADYNDIFFALELPIGKTLLIPSYSTFHQHILNQRKKRRQIKRTGLIKL